MADIVKTFVTSTITHELLKALAGEAAFMAQSPDPQVSMKGRHSLIICSVLLEVLDSLNQVYSNGLPNGVATPDTHPYLAALGGSVPSVAAVVQTALAPALSEVAAPNTNEPEGASTDVGPTTAQSTNIDPPNNGGAI